MPASGKPDPTSCDASLGSNTSSNRCRREKQDTAKTVRDGDDVDSFFHGSNAEDDLGLGQLEGPLMDEPEEKLGWGKGILRDWRSTVGTWWWFEMTNFEQKTIAVTL